MSNEPIRAWVRQLYKTMPAKIWGTDHINMQIMLTIIEKFSKRALVKYHQHAPRRYQSCVAKLVNAVSLAKDIAEYK